MLDSSRGLASLILHHHSPDQSRLDPQLVQGFHFEGIEVDGLALDARDSSPRDPHTASLRRSYFLRCTTTAPTSQDSTLS
jgi:hypothetical protein